MLLLRMLVSLGLIAHCGGCSAWHTVWHHWGPCSHSCGGGTRHRTGHSCVLHEHESGNGKCGEICYNGGSYSGGCRCPAWRTDRCCGTCKHIYIAHCKSGQQQCGGSPDNIKCTDCEDPYYSAGYGRGCPACPTISHCEHRHCTTPSNVKCVKCEDDKVFFQRTHSDTRCENCTYDTGLCAWNNHYCWPGECSNKLTRSCKCADGFHAVKTSSETSCQLLTTNVPSIETCETSIRASDGAMKQAKISSNITSCEYLKDFYGNFQPKYLIYKLLAEFRVDIKPIKPAFIKESHFGVTDTKLTLKRKQVKGVEIKLQEQLIQLDSSNGTRATTTVSNNANISIAGNPNLANGEWLCIDYEVKGGGYLKSIDLEKDPHMTLWPVPYTKTTTVRRLCYRYDSAKPEHCGVYANCSYEPLQLPERITRSSHIAVRLQGWSDPIPVGGSLNHASGIESYEITLQEVTASKDYLKVDIESKQTVKVKSSADTVHLNLSSDTPKLYAIYVEVKDIADNVRQSRRFVLYDNSSFIETNPNKRFYVESASTFSKYSWQTHHNAVCLSWVNYFLNRFYMDNPMLTQVESDPSGLIQGYYEQSTGILPVTGTPNVHGIINYKISWAVNDGTFSSEQNVDDFQRQRFCKQFALNDGETYYLRVKAIDIANNTLTDTRVVHIDRSAPHINNIWLEKDRVKVLFVHSGTDLSQMNITFEALDQHSGIREIKWALGTSDAGSELITGSLRVGAVNSTVCPPFSSDDRKCYCPDVGNCEMHQYYIPLNKLVEKNRDQGNHNRNYFFTIKITNNAMLSNIEHLDVLVDDSPPEVGVILEGPVGSKDVDYTSDDSFIVQWHGFIDHESGIKLYRIALSRKCLTTDEINNTNFTKELPAFEEVPYTETSVRVPANFTGKMITTIIAMNNAMATSKSVCSDGITRDISAPQVRNISLRNAKWSESILCYNGQSWLLNSQLQKIQLHATPACVKMCANISVSGKMVELLPTADMATMDDDVSDFMCQTLPMFKDDTMTIYLPDDHIDISWNPKEDGSQILDFHIGIGSQLSEQLNPSKLGYTPTNHKLFFRKHHLGIGASEFFYIFLKAENKAGIKNIYPIGPIVIDETAPVSDSNPSVHIEGTDIIVTWGNDTIYDLDQIEQINKIFFQFGHGGKPVTPMMEWRLETSPTCPGHIGACFKYPIRHLQKQDTDFGLDFYVTLIGYNNAGHSTKVDTETFQLPSRFPPGNAVVLDIDPHKENAKSDVEVHFVPSTLCSRWNGFRHHENITVEFAVGTTSLTDDVIPFRQIRNTTFYCITSKQLLSGTHYHVLVRSTCSGGQSLSASNGVTILTQDFVDANLIVRVGEACETLNNSVQLSQSSQSGKDVLKPLVSLDIGNTYHIYTSTNVSIFVKKTDGKLNLIKGQATEDFYSFIPFIEQPCIFLLNTPVSSIKIKVVPCSNSRFVKTDTHQVKSTWHFQTGHTYSVDFDAAIIEGGKSLNSSLAVKYQDRTGHMSAVLKYSAIQSGLQYNIAVRICANNRCLQPVVSGNVSFLVQAPNGNISIAEIKSETGRDCFNVTLRWAAFKSESPVISYQWSLSENEMSTSQITPWETVMEVLSPEFEIKRCLSLPVDLHKDMYACVRAFTEGEQRVTICRELSVTSPGAYSTNIVYDLDPRTEAWTELMLAISSSNIGHIYRLLHESEIDFPIPSSKVAGVILYGTERSVVWYLMTKRHIPMSCESRLGCIASVTTENGYSEFTTADMKPNTIYYICAKSNTTLITRELFTETLSELKSCSDGFVINNSPPYGGSINVMQENGYLNDVSDIRISWNGFRDDTNVSALGYINKIKSYSYAIGSRPGGDDLIGYSDVGLTTVKAVNISGVHDGSTVYVSVKAVNRAGLSCVVTTPGLVVDTSPPQTGDVLINQGRNVLYYNNDMLDMRFVGFLDDESGIERYDIQIGSMPNKGNIKSSIHTGEGYSTLKLPDKLLHDGSEYYLTVTAINRAGLYSNSVIKAFIVDKSAPTGGHVVDGDPALMRDTDYQTDIHHIKSYWKGFDDIHSDIQFFRVGLGSKPYEDDVEALVDVGLSTEITWNASFVPGQRYFAAVEACNRAGLCTKRSSDGVILDNSPPIHGIVRVGSGSTHQSHVPRSSSIHIHWHGFEDPQSDIEHFTVCLGSQPGQCDIVPMFNCFLQSNILKAGIDLPKKQYLYATVMAYNKVGIRVAQTSDAFRVDDTPPKLESPPVFVLDTKRIPRYKVQWDPSVLRISWMFSDEDSPITTHFVTLKTHHDGHTPIENLQLGSENNLTISLKEQSWLNNGDRYHAVVTCCNAAGHCTTATSNDLLIDSTPPHLGGFMPPMTWNTSNDTIGHTTSEIFLTWYGFLDQESGIENYYITVSRSYSGNELSNGTVEVAVNSSQEIHQTAIRLNDQIKRDDLLILSIWAQNKAGVNSSIAKVSVNALSASRTFAGPRGSLELEKHSCDTHYCNQDCTCAVIGKPCVAAKHSNNCTILNAKDVQKLNLPVVEVFPGIHGYDQHDQIMTASSACLSGYWRVSNGSTQVKRFEWSMGLINQPTGEGIFDIKNEIPWRDVGLNTDVVHCLSKNRSIIHDEKYVIYVRAWYDYDLSSVFKSKPIAVDQTPPAVGRGKYVSDSDESCSLDFDYIDWMDTITACWGNVFNERQSKITHYTVALGTSSKADDVFVCTNVGLVTNITLTNLNLSHGTKYYFRIMAYNVLGLHTSISSDGFVIDMDIPVAGVVFNTGHHTNAAFQSLRRSFTISWHGFIDHFSGIHSYYVALMQEHIVNATYPTFRDAGLQTIYTFDNLYLNTGMKLRGLVKAVDAAGHESNVSLSPTISIDTTPPQGYSCVFYKSLLNESTDCSVDDNYKITTYSSLNENIFYHLEGEMSKFSIRSTVEFKVDRLITTLPISTQHDGSGQFEYTFLTKEARVVFLELNGNCLPNTQISYTVKECSKTTPSPGSSVSIQQLGLSTLQIKTTILDFESGIKTILTGLGTTQGSFQIKALSPVHQEGTDVLDTDIPHGTRLYATAVAVNHAGLRSVFHSKQVVMDKTPPAVIQDPVIATNELTNTTYSITVSWKIVDKESGIKQCYCQIGNITADDVNDFFPTDNAESCNVENVTLVHGDIVRARVRCINYLEVSTEISAKPFYISKEPPSVDEAEVLILDTREQTRHIANSFQVINQTQHHIAVQSNLSCMQLQWSGFTDTTGISHYEFRLKHDQLPITEWFNAGKQTMSIIRGIHLDSGSFYTAEVRAINTGNHVSDIVRNEILVLGSTPKLTGVLVDIHQTGSKLHLDWSQSFNLIEHVGHVFDLVVGSKRGYNDVIGDLVTTDTTSSFSVPSSTSVSPSVNEIFISVECTYVTGKSTTYVTSFKLL